MHIPDLFSSVVDPDRISTNKAHLAAHAGDESLNLRREPDLVIWPTSTQEVSAVLRIASQHRIPVTAWGGGSSLEGNPNPVLGGLVLDMTRMDRIVAVMPEDFQARVQPGIIGDDLNTQLQRDYGLFFAGVPGSANVATIGGMIANNAGGMYAIKYGVVRENVLALDVVLASGEMLHVGSRSIKSVAGYDLLSLFIGSEGTLGIITEATLRLRGLPQSKSTILASLASVAHAIELTLDILALDLQPAALELMDARFVALANEAYGTAYHASPTLLIELHGAQDRLALDAAQVAELIAGYGALAVYTGDEHWHLRRKLREAIPRIRPGTGILSGDIGVPLSQIKALLSKTTELGQAHGIETVAFGHAGDGNFHLWCLYALDDDEARSRAVAVNEQIVRYALAIGGTITSEHGIGLGKRRFLPLEHATGLPYMQQIKRLFDPAGILNPGKIFLDG